MRNESASRVDGWESVPGKILLGIARRSVRVLSRHGAGGALRLAARRLWARLKGTAFVPDEERRAAEEFDRTYGVETASMEGEALDLAAIEGPNWLHGGKYQGAHREVLDLIDELAPAHEGFTFIDLGSGKGKVLLHAANHGFRRIVGVEYSRRLHEAALENVARCRNPRRRCGSVECVCLDAAGYEFPPEPTFLYLFNPFDRGVMARTAANLADSLRRQPRRVAILYCNALHADVFLEAGFRERTRWSGNFTSVLIEPGAPFPARATAV